MDATRTASLSVIARHGSTFDLRTGNPKALPATLPVLTWPVRVEGEAVMIDIESG